MAHQFRSALEVPRLSIGSKIQARIYSYMVAIDYGEELAHPLVRYSLRYREDFEGKERSPRVKQQ